jgi:hypothetical protein
MMCSASSLSGEQWRGFCVHLSMNVDTDAFKLFVLAMPAVISLVKAAQAAAVCCPASALSPASDIQLLLTWHTAARWRFLHFAVVGCCGC